MEIASPHLCALSRCRTGRTELGINWYLPGQVPCPFSSSRDTQRFNSLNKPWDYLADIFLVDRKWSESQEQGCAQGALLEAGTQISLREGKGDNSEN